MNEICLIPSCVERAGKSKFTMFSEPVNVVVIGSEKLSVVLKDYNTWQRDIKTLNQDVNKLQIEIDKISEQLDDLKAQKEKIDLTNANNFLINTRNILRDIDKIFKDTKNRKFDEFIGLLSEKSNDIFSRINIDAFTGVIDFRLIKTGERLKVKIQSSATSLEKITVFKFF